jgi:hypothetical protein
MTNGNLSPWEFPEWLEKEKDDKLAEAHRRDVLEELLEIRSAQDRDTLTLYALLKDIACPALQRLEEKPTRDALEQTTPEYTGSLYVLLRKVKQAILEGRLIVRRLAPMVIINEASVIQAWCNKNDPLESADGTWFSALKGIAGTPSFGLIVVTPEDAYSWLIEDDIPPPEWLHELVLELEQLEQETPAVPPEEQKNDKETLEQRRKCLIRRRSELISKSMRNFIAEIADEKNISIETLRKIMAKGKKAK